MHSMWIMLVSRGTRSAIQDELSPLSTWNPAHVDKKPRRPHDAVHSAVTAENGATMRIAAVRHGTTRIATLRLSTGYGKLYTWRRAVHTGLTGYPQALGGQRSVHGPNQRFVVDGLAVYSWGVGSEGMIRGPG